MIKRIAALLVSLMLLMSVMSFASAESAVPDVANTYFSYGYDVGFFMDYFIHFYDEVPGMGKVFYAGFCLNQITFSGTYEILPEACDYACWPDRPTQEAAGDDAEVPTGTAPYTVVFYDFDGNEIDRCGMDETHVYLDMANLCAIGCEHNVLTLDTEPETSDFAADYAGELAVAMADFICPDDDTATLTLKVNGRYDDLVIMLVEGTFAMNEDQTVITLTPDSEDDDGAVVSLNEDGTWTYVSDSGDEMTLIQVKAAEVAYTLKGAIPVPGMEGVNADFICSLYDDGTVALYADFMGNRMDVDAGTYEIDMATYSFIIHFDTAGDLTTEGFAADMVLNYAAGNVEPFGAIEQTLAFVAE
ncbi:MAG: hypothetical protein ACI4O7_15905 [Aristaeellaceae bacterium]